MVRAMNRIKITERYKANLDLRNRVVDKGMVALAIILIGVVISYHTDKYKSDLSYSNIYAEKRLDALEDVNEKLGDLYTSYSQRYKNLKKGKPVRSHGEWKEEHESLRLAFVQTVNQHEFYIIELIPSLQFMVDIHDPLSNDAVKDDELKGLECVFYRAQEYVVAKIASQVRPPSLLHRLFTKQEPLEKWVKKSKEALDRKVMVDKMPWLITVNDLLNNQNGLTCNY